MPDSDFMGWLIAICDNCGYPLGAPLNAERLGACPDCHIRLLPVEERTRRVEVVPRDVLDDPQAPQIEAAAARVIRGWRMRYGDANWTARMQNAINRLSLAMKGNFADNYPVLAGADLEKMAEAAHDAWLAEKARRGVKSWVNEDGIEQMVPYSVLDESIRDFDRVVVGAIIEQFRSFKK